MPEELWDTLALLPTLSKIGPYAAQAVLFLMAVTLAVLRVEDQRKPTKLTRVELGISAILLLALLMLNSRVEKGESAIGDYRSWGAVQSAAHGFVPMYTAIACLAFAAVVIGVAVYHLVNRHVQRARLYGCVATGCASLSARAMQFYTLQDAWAMTNLLLTIASVASLGLIVSFIRNEWRTLQEHMKPTQ